MKFTLLLIIYFCLFFDCIIAQTDTSLIKMEEIIITATRTEKQLASVPMPVTLITSTQIAQMGSLRLNEVLQEQTGLAITNDHGQGIQMQGFSSDYTLILIDGEPLIGRTAGTLDLSRLAIGNIKQIEIIKGASSSLYGSEALAGVVNIITYTPKEKKINISTRYGTNQTFDIGVNASIKREKLGINIFMNRYSTAGYDFNPTIFGQTVEPFHNYTLQSKISYDFSSQIKLKIAGRYFFEKQQNNFEINSLSNPLFITGIGRVSDYNFNPTLDINLNSRFKIQLRYYKSRYSASSKQQYLDNNQLFDETDFVQNFSRPEIQFDYLLHDNHTFVGGAGKIWENVTATRYKEQKKFTNSYAFLQHEFNYKKLHLVTGFRFDNHSVYGSQINPKIAIQYELNNKISIRTSLGRGFKAPDFRQLYLNFTNQVAGYSVFGTQEIGFALQNLQNQSQIAQILLNPNEMTDLRPESAWNFNIGLQAKLLKKINFNLNIFRNDVENLIETQVVARKTNGQNVFSYRNINRIFTQGIELDINYTIIKGLNFSTGYQYLEAKDKDVLQKIEDGQIFSRNSVTLNTTRVTKNQYGGLFGRSKNMFNVKIFYENEKKGISANLRAIYRGRYGFGDMDGNLILNNDNEYVAGFWTFNTAIIKNFIKNKIRLQIGIDNLMDYKDEIYQPNIAGRLIWTSINLQF